MKDYTVVSTDDNTLEIYIDWVTASSPVKAFSQVCLVRDPMPRCVAVFEGRLEEAYEPEH